MEKTFTAILLLLSVITLCFIFPLTMMRQNTELLKETQQEYEADYLAWEIAHYHRLDHSVLPSQEIEFYCYNEEMELVEILTSHKTPVLDFTPYFCVIFTHHGKKEGVCLE